MNNPLVSIIVPCFNAEQHLQKTLESLSCQTYKNIQFIFVNDGSTDNTKTLLQSFCNKNSKAILINQNNEGVSFARNVGFKHAEGELIYFCDSDDILHPDIISVLVDAVTNNDSDIACCKFDKFTNAPKIKAHSDKCVSVLGKDNIAVYSLRHWRYNFMLWNKIFKKSLIREIGLNPFDTQIKYSEDMVFYLKYLAFCKKATFVSSKLYFYRMQKNSLTRQNISKNKVHYIDTIEITENLMKSFDNAQPLIKAHICECTRSLISDMISLDWNVDQIRKTYSIYSRNYKNTFRNKNVPLYKRIDFKISNLKTKRQMKKII